MLHFYVAKAAREAAVRGNLVRRRAFVQSLPGEEEYLLESPDGLEVTGILRIAELPRCSCPRDVRRTFTFPEGCRFCGRRTAWYEPQDRALHIDRTCCGSEFLVELAVAPARDASAPGRASCSCRDGTGRACRSAGRTCRNFSTASATPPSTLPPTA